MADSPYVYQAIREPAQMTDTVRGLRLWRPHGNPSWIPILIFIAVFCLIILIKYLRDKRLGERINHLYEEKRSTYDEILSHYNPYYKSLGSENKERFLRRTISFIQAKEFKYIGLEEEEKIPLLISATAIQLTFGLDHYLLNYFRTIYVVKDSYSYGQIEKPFEGHVNDDGIYLSWNHFLKQFDNYTDGENVGLHEMAHALTYVNLTVREGKDDTFRSKFYEFSPLARPIFNRMKEGETTLLDKYAASSFEEFWAVSIETFFERPFPFREQLPELYSRLCDLLNQDPLSPDKIQVNAMEEDINYKNFLKTAWEAFKF